MLTIRQRHRRTDRQTDGRTDDFTIAIPRFALRASRGKNVCSLAVNDRRQAESCNFSRNTIQCNKMFVIVCQQRTSTVPKIRGTCGIAVLKSTVKATVVVP